MEYKTTVSRENVILLLQDDLDKFLETYIAEGGDKSWGKIVIYENFNYHIDLLERGEIPSYSNTPADDYGFLKSLPDYEILTEWLAYGWLEDQVIEDDVLNFTGEYLQWYNDNK